MISRKMGPQYFGPWLLPNAHRVVALCGSDNCSGSAQLFFGHGRPSATWPAALALTGMAPLIVDAAELQLNAERRL